MDLDVNAFATDLYNFIWWKFKFSIAEERIGDKMHEVIGMAVACQQLLVRNYIKEKFILRHTYVMEHPGFIHEMSTNLAQGRLDYFTHLFRCSAFIAEYFIYKSNCYIFTDLGEASLVWIEMFKTKFIQNFEINGGWKAMVSAAERIFSEYFPLFEKYEEKLFVPEFRFVPRNLCTSFDKIKVEIILGYAGYDLYDEWKELRTRPTSFPCPCRNINARSRSNYISIDPRASESGSPRRKKPRSAEGLKPVPSLHTSAQGSGIVYRVNYNRPWERVAYGPYGRLEGSSLVSLPTDTSDSSKVDIQKGTDPAVPMSLEVQDEFELGTSTKKPMEEDP